jgi:hypothetical protein
MYFKVLHNFIGKFKNGKASNTLGRNLSCKFIYFVYLKVLSNGAGGGPKLVSIDPF